MQKTVSFEKFPFWIIFLSNLHSILIYLTGLFVLYKFHRIAAAIYLIYILFLEIRIIRTHCINCYYYGKLCGFGKGRISAALFKKGNPSDFCKTEMTWKDMIPDMLVTVIPFIAGIVMLIIHFDILVLISLITLLLLASMGNAFIRGSLTCKYCKQKELGCPADKLFNKE